MMIRHLKPSAAPKAPKTVSEYVEAAHLLTMASIIIPQNCWQTTVLVASFSVTVPSSDSYPWSSSKSAFKVLAWSVWYTSV
jgi:hypothetical protein